MSPSFMLPMLAVGLLSFVLNDREIFAFDHTHHSSTNENDAGGSSSGGINDPVEQHDRNNDLERNDFGSINDKSNDENDENSDNVDMYRSNQQNTGNLASSQSASSSLPDSTNTDDDAGSGNGNGENDNSNANNDGISNGSSDNGNNRESSSSYYYNNYYNNGENRRVHSVQYDEELTYLDIFGEVAHEVLTQHIIPSTDVECHWDWRTARCEPYCNCAYLFLWGDFHLGRSCRYRTSPPPTHFVNDDDVDQHVSSGSSDYEPSWQEAWQEIWNKGTPTASDTPMTRKSSNRETEEEEEEDTATAWDNKTTEAACSLPPENLYIRLVRRLTTYTTRSNIVHEQLKKLKSASTNTMDAGIVHGRHHLTQIRHKACQTVKSKVAERANGRDQPVLLTKQGATWIRRVCGGDIVDNDTVPPRRFVVP